MVLIILSIITIAFISVIILGICVNEDSIFMVGIVLLVFTLFFGWGMVGCYLPVKSYKEYIKGDIQVIKTKTAVIIEYKGIREIFEDAASYNAISTNSNFELVTGYNSYDQVISRRIKLLKEEIKGEKEL